jgi:hypothetical protein
MTDPCPRTFCSDKAPYCSRAGDKFTFSVFCSQKGGCRKDTDVYMGTQKVDGVACTANADGVSATCTGAPTPPPCPASCTPQANQAAA